MSEPVTPRARASAWWVAYLPALAGVAALVAYAAMAAFPAPGAAPVPRAAPWAATAFTALQLLVPPSRPSRVQLVSPLHWALVAFLLQLVVMPLVVSWAGPAQSVLPYLPNAWAVDRSIELSILAFAAFTVGCALTRRPRRGADLAIGTWIPRLVVLLYALLGLVGLLLRFGSLGAVFANLADPSRLADVELEQAGTLQGAASTFLRPFLLTSLAMAWSLWIDRRAETATRLKRVAVTAVTAAGVLVVGATYGFNRAAFMVPLVAMAAAYSTPGRRLSLSALALAGAVLAVLAIVPAQYRLGGASAEELARSETARAQVFDFGKLGTELQVYGAAPQFAGFVLEAAQLRNERFTGHMLLSSLLSPVPVVGKDFRETSGPIAYNRLIYGNVGVVDQIFPFEAEVYLCLGPAGLVAAFVLLGAAIGRLQRAFERAASAFDRYALQFAAMWLTFLVQGSLAAVSQVFVFFMWPFYGYFLLRLAGAARGRRVGVGAVEAG